MGPDIPRVVEIVEAARRRGRYATIGAIDRRRLKNLLLQGIVGHGRNMLFNVAVAADGAVRGVMLAALDNVYLIGKPLSATDLFTIVDDGADARDFARLIRALIDWAEADPRVVEVRLGATDAVGDRAHVARVTRAYERFGLEPEGVIYRKTLGNGE